jgi:hypothetical protein
MPWSANSSSPASLPEKPAPLHRVAGRWVIGDCRCLHASSLITGIHNPTCVGDALRIPAVMGDTQHSTAGSAATDSGEFTNTPPALRPELTEHRATGGGARVAWGQEGGDDAFDAGVSAVVNARALCAMSRFAFLVTVTRRSPSGQRQRVCWCEWCRGDGRQQHRQSGRRCC